MTRTRSELPDDVLEDIGRLMSSSDDYDHEWWFDAEALEVVVIERGLLERLGEEADDQLPEWKRQECELARQIEADDAGRYLQIPAGSTGHGRLHAFAHSLSDPVLAEAVWEAMAGGRGAYRRVKDLLYQRDALDLWHRFEEAQYREDALGWLRQEGVLADEVAEQPSSDPAIRQP